MKSFAEAKAIVQVVLPHGWVDRINQLALERGLNRSALIREAIARTYFEQRAEGGKGGEQTETNPVHQARK
jgi:metal-responsive CopG/Arc/MetJ family transcriptional regulator